MSERNKHLFQFSAAKIADAASGESTYHNDRLGYWQSELVAATETVERTASVVVKRVPMTGGWSPQVVVNYGDSDAYARMQLAGGKIQQHTAARDRFRSDADLYSTQGETVYALDADDVAHFRFNGRVRDE